MKKSFREKMFNHLKLYNQNKMNKYFEKKNKFSGSLNMFGIFGLFVIFPEKEPQNKSS